MPSLHRKRFNIAFLFIFLILILTINHFHTEDTLKRSDNCPACQFQNSTLMTAQIHFFHLPQLSTFEMLKIFESFFISNLFYVAPSSRSPPQSWPIPPLSREDFLCPATQTLTARRSNGNKKKNIRCIIHDFVFLRFPVGSNIRGRAAHSGPVHIHRDTTESDRSVCDAAV